MAENVKMLLLKAGWKENRNVDGTKLKELIIMYGFRILPKALEFLEEFEGLIIRFPNLKNGINDDITLDFVKAAELEGNERIAEEYELRIGKKLSIVGTAYREHFALIMDEDGKVYGAYDSFLVKIGDSGVGAIEAIINNEKFIEIP
jgi:hypothetical protein